MPSAYANQSAGELSSMCDGPQTMEALAVRRSRDVGGGKLHVTQERVREVLEGVWKSGPRGWKDKGRRQDKAIPEAWNWKLEGSKSKLSATATAGGWWHGSGVLSRGGDRFCGEAGSTSINAIKPSGAEGLVGRDRQRYSTSWAM